MSKVYLGFFVFRRSTVSVFQGGTEYIESFKIAKCYPPICYVV
nr:MAG TPA: hypothetical protein [Caudoviricetes sp.]